KQRCPDTPWPNLGIEFLLERPDLGRLHALRSATENFLNRRYQCFGVIACTNEKIRAGDESPVLPPWDVALREGWLLERHLMDVLSNADDTCTWALGRSKDDTTSERILVRPD